MSKYTFVKGANPTVVWDAVKNRRLCKFEDGLFSTNDAKVAKALRKAGYQEMKDFPDGPPPEGFTPPKTKLAPPVVELSPSGRAAPTQKPDLDDDGVVEDVVINQKLKGKGKKVTATTAKGAAKKGIKIKRRSTIK